MFIFVCLGFDSGITDAHNSGQVIDAQQLCNCVCTSLQPGWTEWTRSTAGGGVSGREEKGHRTEPTASCHYRDRPCVVCGSRNFHSSFCHRFWCKIRECIHSSVRSIHIQCVYHHV